MATITIKQFSTMPELAMEGWNPNACDATDYKTARAGALYEALGVSPGDDEYALAKHTDGRWALIGLTVSGHKYAEETGSKLAAIGSDGTRPVVWGLGTTEAEAREDAQHWLTANQMPEPREVETCAVDDLRIVEVNAERVARIQAGDVDASDLWTMGSAA